MGQQLAANPGLYYNDCFTNTQQNIFLSVPSFMSWSAMGVQRFHSIKKRTNTKPASRDLRFFFCILITTGPQDMLYGMPKASNAVVQGDAQRMCNWSGAYHFGSHNFLPVSESGSDISWPIIFPFLIRLMLRNAARTKMQKFCSLRSMLQRWRRRWMPFPWRTRRLRRQQQKRLWSSNCFMRPKRCASCKRCSMHALQNKLQFKIVLFIIVFKFRLICEISWDSEWFR